MALPGLSTLGIRFGYGIETTAGTKPTAVTPLSRINTIAGISLSSETIDASALEDFIEKSVAGRQSTGGTWPITVNVTPDTIAEWKVLATASATAKAENKNTWFEVYHPQMTDAFWVIADVPANIPMPESAQNGLWTVEITLTINEYKGLLPAVSMESEEEEEETM